MGFVSQKISNNNDRCIMKIKDGKIMEVENPKNQEIMSG